MTRFQRVLQVWSLLVCAARDRRIYTYGQIADALGMPGARRTVASFLGPIMYYCRQKRFPPLTVLVVNQGTGRPGKGLIIDNDVDKERERVFRHNWFKMKPPETADFEEAWNNRRQ